VGIPGKVVGGGARTGKSTPFRLHEIHHPYLIIALAGSSLTRNGYSPFFGVGVGGVGGGVGGVVN